MSIIKLYRAKKQPTVETTEASTQASESWHLTTDSFSLPIQVDILVKSLSSTNEFSFPIIGQTHPNNSSLVVTKIVVSRTDETYTKHMLTTTLTNNKASIDSAVKPSRAQDTYNFSHAIYEDIVSNATYASKAKKSDTLGLSGEGDAIENNNGVGIVVTEEKSIVRCVIVRNEDDYDLKKASEHVGKVNGDKLSLVGSTFGAGQCKLVEWAGADAYDSDGKLYWRVTYEILITDDPSFFEKKFIMRGTTNKNGETAPTVPGLIADTEYKLDSEGLFFLKPDQSNPKKFYAISFPTLEISNWGKAVQLSASPNENITNLTGDSGFGLIKS